jgi:tRNA threonylcarbamoyladenosine biosynthesis protein TsaE
MPVFEVNSLSEYNEVFSVLDECLKTKSIVLLEGDLGAGKTTFVKEYLKHRYDLSDQEIVKKGFSSPTFSIENHYEINNELIVHYDFYRIDDDYEIEEHIDDFESSKIVFIEWQEKLRVKDSLSKKKWLEIKIKVFDEMKRSIELDC